MLNFTKRDSRAAWRRRSRTGHGCRPLPSVGTTVAPGMFPVLWSIDSYPPGFRYPSDQLCDRGAPTDTSAPLDASKVEE